MNGYTLSRIFGTVDGPGLDISSLVQDADFDAYCHNPDSWKMKEGKVTEILKLFQKFTLI